MLSAHRRSGSSEALSRARRLLASRRRRRAPTSSKRQVPLSPELVAKLRAHHAETEWPGADDFVFLSLAGTPLDPNNMRARVLKPVAEEAGAPWAGFHTFRHTYASLMLAGGANVLQLSRALGHHSPAFTLPVSTHLLDGEHAPALHVGSELRGAMETSAGEERVAA